MSLKDVMIGASKNFLESLIQISPITSLVGFLHAMCLPHFQLPRKGESFAPHLRAMREEALQVHDAQRTHCGGRFFLSINNGRST